MSRLTDLAIKNARKRERPYKLTDGRGLYVLIRPDGAKWWRLDFNLPGKPRRTMSLGTYPAVELGKAREERDRIKDLVKQGIDPVAERKQTTADEGPLFGTIARQWMNAQRAEWTQRNYDVLMRRLEQMIFPDLGRMDIRTIAAPDLLRVIRKIEAKGAKELPARMNGVCGRIFRYAEAEGWAVTDSSRTIREALKRQAPKVHRAFIRPADVGSFLARLADGPYDDGVVTDAMMLTILCATRTGEVRFAEVSEFEGLGGKEPVWRIPAVRMKMRRPHLVPLSTQAVAIVRRRMAGLKEGQKLLFARRTVSGTVSENSMLYSLYRMGFHSRATMHGFRRTFSTWANEARDGDGRPSWPPEWIEWALAHVQKDKVRAAYNAAEYLTDRRRLLQAWADWLDRERTVAALIG